MYCIISCILSCSQWKSLKDKLIIFTSISLLNSPERSSNPRPFSNASIEYSRFFAPSDSHCNFLILIYIFGASLEAKLCMATRRQQWPNALILLTFNQARATDTTEKRDCAAAALRPRLKQTKDALRWQRRQLQNILHFAVEFSIGSGYEFPFPFSFPLERDLFTCNLLPYTTSATHQHPPPPFHTPPLPATTLEESKSKQSKAKDNENSKRNKVRREVN